MTSTGQPSAAIPSTKDRPPPPNIKIEPIVLQIEQLDVGESLLGYLSTWKSMRYPEYHGFLKNLPAYIKSSLSEEYRESLKWDPPTLAPLLISIKVGTIGGMTVSNIPSKFPYLKDEEALRQTLRKMLGSNYIGFFDENPDMSWSSDEEGRRGEDRPDHFPPGVPIRIEGNEITFADNVEMTFVEPTPSEHEQFFQLRQTGPRVEAQDRTDPWPTHQIMILTFNFVEDSVHIEIIVEIQEPKLLDLRAAIHEDDEDGPNPLGMLMARVGRIYTGRRRASPVNDPNPSTN